MNIFNNIWLLLVGMADGYYEHLRQQPRNVNRHS